MYKYIGKTIDISISNTLRNSIHSLFNNATSARLILGQKAPQEAVNQLNHELGFDKPFLIRFANYIKDAVQGDFGKSYLTDLYLKKFFQDSQQHLN